jgi:protoporphyrinogen oxidase
MEFWCWAEDEMWQVPDEDLIEMAKKEIRQTGLNKGAEILDGKVYRINRCYPVYSKGYREVLEPIENYLRTVKNLFAIGRYGAFKYNNQDHSILMGLLAAENILQGENNDLWQINTDYDEYQEASIITQTGLQKQ